MAFDDERLRLGLAVDGHANRVCPGRGRGTGHAAAPEDHAGERRRVRVAQVPRHAVEPGAHRRARTGSAAAASAATASAAAPAAGRFFAPRPTMIRRTSARPCPSDRRPRSRATARACAAGTESSPPPAERIAASGLKRYACAEQHLRRVLAQRPDAIEDVEPAPVRRDDEIVRLDDQIADLRVGQVERKRLPVIAVVVRDVEAVLRAGVEQAAPRLVLADDVRVVVAADAGDDLRPGRAVVVRAEEVRREVVEQRLLDRDVRRARVERRCVDDADAPEVRHVLRRDVLPGLAAVACDLHVAVVGARPNHVDVALRRPDREDRARRPRGCSCRG